MGRLVQRPLRFRGEMSVGELLQNPYRGGVRELSHATQRGDISG